MPQRALAPGLGKAQKLVGPEAHPGGSVGLRSFGGNLHAGLDSRGGGRFTPPYALSASAWAVSTPEAAAAAKATPS